MRELEIFPLLFDQARARHFLKVCGNGISEIAMLQSFAVKQFHKHPKAAGKLDEILFELCDSFGTVREADGDHIHAVMAAEPAFSLRSVYLCVHPFTS